MSGIPTVWKFCAGLWTYWVGIPPWVRMRQTALPRAGHVAAYYRRGTKITCRLRKFTRAERHYYRQVVFLPVVGSDVYIPIRTYVLFERSPRNPRNAHRRLGREHRLEEVLSVRVARKVTDGHTVSWDGNRWGVPREEVCAGLRGAQVEIERRLDGTHWLRFRGRYLPLLPYPNALRRSKPNTMCLPITLGENLGGGHFYLAETRTFLLCVDSKDFVLTLLVYEKRSKTSLLI
jgi:hypothetical protein